MTDTLKHHEGTVSISDKIITNLIVADDSDGLAGKEEELTSVVKFLNKTSAAYGTAISTEKQQTEMITNKSAASALILKSMLRN